MSVCNLVKNHSIRPEGKMAHRSTAADESRPAKYFYQEPTVFSSSYFIQSPQRQTGRAGLLGKQYRFTSRYIG